MIQKPPAHHGRIRVVVADDSLVAREMLVQMLESDEEIEVIATAANGREAVAAVKRFRPDCVTMDIHMPEMDGLEATEQIMAYSPTPILVVSSSVYGSGTGRAFDALAIGALEVIKKPEVRDWAMLEPIRRDIVNRVKLLARVKVITHIRGKRAHTAHGAQHATEGVIGTHGTVQIVAVGSSTGGPSALLSVLARLPEDFPVPIVIAQHIAAGFVPGLAQWLDESSALRVVPACDCETMKPGTAYLAATGYNMEIDGMRIRLVKPYADQLYVPSADVLFESVARVYGGRSLGVLLTGMGADGATGLKAMFDSGALTICQDQATSIVWGMPKAAIDRGAARSVLPVHAIADEIMHVVRTL